VDQAEEEEAHPGLQEAHLIHVMDHGQPGHQDLMEEEEVGDHLLIPSEEEAVEAAAEGDLRHHPGITDIPN
jgi:hypothetical protein